MSLPLVELVEVFLLLSFLSFLELDSFIEKMKTFVHTY